MSTSIEHLSFNKHKDLRFSSIDCYPLAKNITINPIYHFEIIQLSRYFPIVFPGPTTTTTKLPIALFALSAKDKNRFVDNNGVWIYDYIPARIRCYPFGLTKINAESKESLLVDIEAPHFKKTEGLPLFNEDGSPTELLQDKIDFFSNLKREEQKTELFVKLLDDAGLLVPKKVLSNKHSEKCFTGFYIVDKQKFATLDAEVFISFRQKNILPLIYAHLASLDRFENLATHKETPHPTINPETVNIGADKDKEKPNIADIPTPKPNAIIYQKLQTTASHMLTALIGAVVVLWLIKPNQPTVLKIQKAEKAEIAIPNTNKQKIVETAKIDVAKIEVVESNSNNTTKKVETPILSSQIKIENNTKKRVDTKTVNAITKTKTKEQLPVVITDKTTNSTIQKLPTNISRLNLEKVIGNVVNTQPATLPNTPIKANNNEIIVEKNLETQNKPIKQPSDLNKAINNEKIAEININNPKELIEHASDLNKTDIALLKAANNDIIARRLTRPIGKNAIEKINLVLEKHPNNPQAKKLLKKVIDRFVGLVKIDISNNRLSSPVGNNALHKINNIRSLDKYNSVATSLQINVAEKYASLAEGYLITNKPKGRKMLIKAIKLAPKSDKIKEVYNLYK
ncbi:MAG: SapC family protein [Magnetococcales bacterium]|nr:SapC family protein [Magnetococcales bacterium]